MYQYFSPYASALMAVLCLAAAQTAVSQAAVEHVRTPWQVKCPRGTHRPCQSAATKHAPVHRSTTSSGPHVELRTHFREHVGGCGITCVAHYCEKLWNATAQLLQHPACQGPHTQTQTTQYRQTTRPSSAQASTHHDITRRCFFRSQTDFSNDWLVGPCRLTSGFFIVYSAVNKYIAAPESGFVLSGVSHIWTYLVPPASLRVTYLRPTQY